MKERIHHQFHQVVIAKVKERVFLFPCRKTLNTDFSSWSSFLVSLEQLLRLYLFIRLRICW